MHNPDAVVDYRGEYIEIHNRHSQEIDLNGLTVVSSNEAGFTINTSVTVAAGGYVVLGTRSNSAVNGGASVDYQYNYGTFKLYNNETISISNGGTTFDTVVYSASTYQLEAGVALILDNSSLDSTSNDNADNWCVSSNVFGDGDFGTPGSANDGCNSISSISPGDLIITEVMQDPAAVADYRGEWFEIYNTTNSAISLNGLTLSSGETDNTINTNITVLPGDYAVLAARSNTNVNGGVTADYAYTYGNLVLYKTDSISISVGATTIDTFSWNKNVLVPTAGVSYNLTPSAATATNPGTQNDNSANWCDAVATYGDGDKGTPGTANANCAGIDFDGDGFFAGTDCDDNDASVSVTTYYRDFDGDTYGTSSDTETGCTPPSGYVAIDGDCNDTNSSVNPDATEECDGFDNDCDGATDDADSNVDLSTGTTWYHDNDSDNYGDDTDSTIACDAGRFHLCQRRLQ